MEEIKRSIKLQIEDQHTTILVNLSKILAKAISLYGDKKKHLEELPLILQNFRQAKGGLIVSRLARIVLNWLENLLVQMKKLYKKLLQSLLELLRRGLF